MTLIVCLDQQNGLMFNNRRQSFDRYVQNMIQERVSDQPLIVAEYSIKKFPDAQAVNTMPASFDGFCFAETKELATSCLPFAETVIVYRWDKSYPADTYFSVEESELFELTDSFEFEGYSHETVTEEIYVRA